MGTSRIDVRTGYPIVSMRAPPEIRPRASSNAIATDVADRASNRFAKPGTAFGSWSTIGMCARRAASIGGTLT